MADRSLTAVDLFCGAGGLSTGLRWAGFDIIWAIDSDEKALKTYNENHGEVETEVCDIRETHPPELDTSERLDLVAGGPPCPTFSKVGRVKLNSLDDYDLANDSRHQLWQHFLRFVAHYEPRTFLMENVPGMASKTNDAGENVLSIITDQIEEIGYRTSSVVVDAADYGVPQHRKRLFIIGNRMEASNPDLREWRTHREPRKEQERQARLRSWEKTSEQQYTLGDFASEDTVENEVWEKSRHRRPYVTVGEAILDLPPLSPAGERVSGDGTHPPMRADSYKIPAVTEYQEWARNIPENKDREEVPLRNHECRYHNMTDLSIYKLLGQATGWTIGDLPDDLQPYRSDVFADSYTKQNPVRPSSTIPAHLHKDGHMHIHPSEARSITVREAARLQSFRDTYRFPVSRTAAFRQVGNAVPPLLAEQIGNAISKTLL